MLYFRFDFEKENFKGSEHKSVLFGYAVDDIVDLRFEEENECLNGYYLNTYKELKEKYFDNDEITEEEYDKKLSQLKQEYIDDELTLNGCSCFELTEDGIEFSNRYKYDDRPLITIFEGEETETGDDGEIVARCEKIVWQGESSKITDIFYDDDIKDKVTAILNLIK